MRIAVDVMGGDNAPCEMVAGAVEWVNDNDSQVLLVGDQKLITGELRKYSYDSTKLQIVSAAEVIKMEEPPVTAIRKKKDASIVVANNLVKREYADALVSCGSTGAQLAAAIFILGRIEGVERPPIVAAIPNAAGRHSLLLDVGANVDCKPGQLLQFAVLGKVYASLLAGINNPKVALLNNGEEETKGNTLNLQSYKLFKEQKHINFVGNIEGRDIFTGKCDVIVCDGFVGNILLKTMEGMALFMASTITKELGKTPTAFGAWDYRNIGGAPLLGIKGVSIVCHGSSKRDAVYNGIKIAEDCFRNRIVQMQQKELVNILS